MIIFLTWLGSTIAEFWQFLCDTDVPGCNFTFAALFISLLVIDFGIFIMKIVFTGNTLGGTNDAKNIKRGK